MTKDDGLGRYMHYRTLGPRPIAADQLSDDYEARVRYFARRLSHVLPLDKDASILDLGCGAGEFLTLARLHGFDRVLGVDLSPEQLEVARTMGHTNVVEADAVDFLTRDTRLFDFILASHIVEHFEGDGALRFLSAVASRLSIGGHLVVLTPNAASPFGLPYAFGDFTHRTFFSASSLVQAARMSGLEVESLNGVPPRGSGLRGALRVRLWALLQKCLRPLFGDDSLPYRVLEPELVGAFTRTERAS